MNKFNSTIILAGLLFFTSCNFEASVGDSDDSESVDKNVKIIEDGLECDNAYLSKNDEKFEKNVTFGEQIQMNFEQVKGLKVVDEAIRADIMFLFTTLDGDTVQFYNYGDIKEQDFELPNNKGVTDLNVYTPVSAPMYSEEKYIFRAGLKDVRTGNKIEGETEIKVNPNYDIEVENSGFEYREVALYNETTGNYILDQETKLPHGNAIRIFRLDGFNLVDGNAMVGASLLIENDRGAAILDIEDLGAGMENGMPFVDIREILTVDFTIGNSNPTSFADVTTKIWDKNGDAEMVVKTRVEIVN